MATVQGSRLTISPSRFDHISSSSYGPASSTVKASEYNRTDRPNGTPIDRRSSDRMDTVDGYQHTVNTSRRISERDHMELVRLLFIARCCFVGDQKIRRFTLVPASWPLYNSVCSTALCKCFDRFCRNNMIIESMARTSSSSYIQRPRVSSHVIFLD